MSRYTPSEYRARERSRSPPRFGADRRASTANLFDGRPPGPARSASDAPRGPRSQFDNARPPLPAGGPPGNATRPTYPSLRDAPPLGSGDRGRAYREREYDRRDRLPSPRDRSPRNLKDTRDFPPREGDLTRPRRDSRDGPLPSGSNFADGASLSGAPFRGAFRGRGRGDGPARGGRGGRSDFGERDLIRRPDRSPPRGWARDTSRDSRDSDRRDDRRFDRREEDRRLPEWQDRERDRELDRSRRDPPPSRLDARNSNESLGSTNATYASAPATRINPDRLAIIENQSSEQPARRPSMQHDVPPPRDIKREQTETPSYLNGRAATAATRYGTRGSSSPQQAPPVPAFTHSFAPAAASSAPSSQLSQSAKPGPELTKAPSARPQSSGSDQTSLYRAAQPAPPLDAPTGPKDALSAPKPRANSPTSAAPRAPRGHETEEQAAFGSRLQQTRSLETLPSQNGAATSTHNWRQERTGPLTQQSPAAPSGMPTLNQPASPYPSQSGRSLDIGAAAPSGPRAARTSPAQANASPNTAFTSPRSDVGQAQIEGQLPKQSTPPPTAPTGPRARPYSVSPKAAPPTAPKAERGPPLAPRGLERGPAQPSRAPDRLAAPSSWQPPSAPRGLQWNQWKRPGPGGISDKTVPAKRDITGEEKGRTDAIIPAQARAGNMTRPFPPPPVKTERSAGDEMEIDNQTPKRQSSLMSGSGHSAAQNFFGKPVADVEEDENDTGMSEAGQDVPSTSEDDDSDPDEDNLALFQAKFERQKRQLEAQMVDLSQPRYRAMSPLESISRLVRISARDLQRVNEIREREMDVDDSPALQHSHLPRTAQSSESADAPDLPTPRGDEDHRVAIRDSDDSSEGIRRVRRPSPERISLPYLVKDKRHSFSGDHFRRQQDAGVDVVRALDEEVQVEEDILNDIEVDFVEQYRKWKIECEDLDRFKDEQERLERQASLEPKPEVDVPLVQPINTFEGRGRLHKYSSEYDVEQVLKQSEETARIEQERQDREAKKNQADMEKEATVPDQRTHAEAVRAMFIDNNGFREPERLTKVFSYEPPADDFSENEQQIFIAAFKETPKKWGEIASLLPGRTYEACIRHYYTNKWDGRFRDNRTKKLKAGGRRGRGGARGPRGRMGGLMADLARPEDFLSVDAMNERGRPKRAAAPTTFGEKEAESKAALMGQSPAKKLGPMSKKDSDADGVPEKPGKRQKRAPGEKPGRKAKNGQPLLAAAPQGSPAKQFLSHDQPRAQKLEEASLLAGLQAGHQGVFNPDGHMVYHQERYLQPTGPPDDPGNPRPSQAPAAKQSASSYWSVPEQQDFLKYIAYFGHDFAAIAAHMGTKTQTMIKNHFQRQVEGGNRPELERAASDADERRARREDIGPPPTPTPIQKRKYESVPSSAQQRPLAPQAEAMDIDEGGSLSRVHGAKHASPPQYQARPLMTSSIQGTPVQASRVAQSPLPASVAPAQPQVSNAPHMRPSQHPLGSRISLLPDNHHDQRPPSQAGFGLRAAEDSAARAQAHQSNRPPTDARNPQYITELVQEQQRAMRLQEQQLPPERAEQYQRQNPLLRHPSQGSPLSQPVQHQQERKSVLDDRAPTPPRPFVGGTSTFARPLSSAPFQPLSSMTFSSLGNRSGFGYSPTKREEPRPAPMSSIPPANTPPKPSTPADPPKRSTVMSLLNDDDPPPPPKRENPTPVSQPQRTSSPANLPHMHGSTSATPASSVPGLRREPSFGQASMPQSQFGRMSFGQSSTPVQAPPTPKNEPGSGNASVSQTPKPEWHPRMFSQPPPPPSQQNPSLEREVRPLFQHGGHRSLLGALGQPRANPSPPPMGSVSHSRTPSLTTRPEMQGREQGMPGSLGQQQSSHQPGQALHPNPYASQPPPFSQPQNQAQNQAHHSHNSSLGAPGPFPSLHHRVPSRDEQYRQEQAHRDRERSEQYRQHEAKDAERRREEEQRYIQQQQQQQQRQHEQDRLHRQQPQPLQPPPFSSAPFGGVDLRRQSQMETQQAMEQERLRNEADRRRQEGLLPREREDEYRRRQQEEMFRRTPLGGGYGVPPRR